MGPYPLLKLIHILSATLLFGTGLGSAFYMWRARLSGDIRVIARVSRDLVLADWLFTTPAILVQLASGLGLMQLTGYGLEQGWLRLALGLFILAGACWLLVVWIQLQVRKLATQALKPGGQLPPAYDRLMWLWFALGWPAFLAVLAIFYLMVFKPR